jgi:hypothetical protein
MIDISEAERLAFITREQVRLVNTQADIAEDEARAFAVDRARQARPYYIDWSTGQRAIFCDNVIPFPLQRRLNR